MEPIMKKDSQPITFPSPLVGRRKPLDVSFEELGNEYAWHYAERNLPEPEDVEEQESC